MAWDDVPDRALTTAHQLLDLVKERDPFTFYHCCRVGRGSRRLAKAIGLNEFEQAILEFGGLFHDIGKSQIPKEILVKSGRLDKAEIAVMKSHAEISVEMIKHLEHVPFFRFMMPGVRYHHEKIDGTGYPHNMRGEQIPLFARLIAVVDSYDAMTNVRPYRNPLSEDKAIQELKDFSGRQFDSHLAKAFIELLPHMKKSNGEPSADELVIASIIKAA